MADLLERSQLQEAMPSHAGPIEQGFDDVPLVQANTAAQPISDFDFGGQTQDVIDGCADIIR